MAEKIRCRDVRAANYKYILAEDYRVQTAFRPTDDVRAPDDYVVLAGTGLLTIRTGYASDGPSGPTVDTKTFMRGAFVHDALYQLLRLGLLPSAERKLADDELRRMCIEDGMSRIRARWVYWGVRLGGRWAAKQRPPAKVETAP